MGVKVEVFKMVLYLSFPVAMFWIANQAEFFEEYVIKKKRETSPPNEEAQRKMLEEFRVQFLALKRERMLKKLSVDSDNGRTQ